MMPNGGTTYLVSVTNPCPPLVISPFTRRTVTVPVVKMCLVASVLATESFARVGFEPQACAWL